MKKLDKRVAIITGGSGSIGKTTAKLFLEQGAYVMLIDLNEEALKTTVLELGSENVKYVVADVSVAAQVEAYVNETVRAFGEIDVFFNNAGIEGVVNSIEDYPENIFDRVISVNVKGVWLGNKYVLPKMKDGSSIILTSSVAGIVGFANLSAYVTSKHAVVGIMRATAIEAAPRKIRVNTIHPSPVNNRMMRSIEEGASTGHGEEVKKAFEASIPFGRYAEPIEIAKLALFLACDDSQFITGTTQVIDGGMTVQ
ncbi:SDR family NAD(P)-dependent oxidoreductase [Sphingobacterium sp. 2149]|uniref:SDR family NAD(P)-dependent oxidoreductase n=1 Tax=Sphingobacterium sp. 2149 TaxID=2817763 RepID=UPI001AE51751|nr:SDR family NAD(P)-dependent oxidoreductase [Sphingobacterium sp. 2149]MDR6736246.1 NAD(P)-dependent dehydrogenase (short-subunit alcohol dehydrogenase family) [Sphingobacterium sp. 2149]